MLKKIVSGGQVGADQGALDAAIKYNFSHGGWIQKGLISVNYNTRLTTIKIPEIKN